MKINLIKAPKEYLTVTQAAGMLNVSNVTFKKYISSGKIKAIKTPGGHYRISRKVIMTALD
jgi:excisionase family DNA binding protein